MAQDTCADGATEASKPCTTCGKVLPVTEFYWVSKALGTLRGQCKGCMKVSKAAQRDPEWTPSCNRCGERLSSRTGSGRRLCSDCFAEVYDTSDRRENGAHRLRMRPCTLCGGPKERFERGKLCGACRPWAGYAKSLRRFGLTPTDYLAILDAQGGTCYICATPPNGKRLCIDHDHSLPDGRDAVRGLLCDECNYNRLPRFAENLAMMRRAVEYLTEAPAQAILKAEGHRTLFVA
jgi:hypothetical protein